MSIIERMYYVLPPPPTFCTDNWLSRLLHKTATDWTSCLLTYPVYIDYLAMYLSRQTISNVPLLASLYNDSITFPNNKNWQKEVIAPKISSLLVMILLQYHYKMILRFNNTLILLLAQGHCYWTIGKELWGGGDRWAVIGQWSTWPQSSPLIGQSPGHHGDDRAAAGRRRGPRRGQEADGGEDVADRGDPVRRVLAPIPHLLHPCVLRAKYVDTGYTVDSTSWQLIHSFSPFVSIFIYFC